MSTEKLPRYDFVEPHQNPDLLQGATDYLESQRVQLPPEIPKTPEFEHQIREMGEAIVNYGHQLGLDLSQRLRDSDSIHVLGPESMEELYEMFPHQRGALGVALTTKDIVVKQMGPERTAAAMLQNLNHEIIHVVAISDTILTPDSSGWNVEELRGGFAFSNGDFHGLNEYYTEKINQKIVTQEWPKHPALRDISKLESTAMPDASPEMTYNDLMLFGERLDAKISSVAGEGALIALERDYFTVNSDALRVLDETLGPDGVKALASLRTHHPADVKKTATALGLDLSKM